MELIQVRTDLHFRLCDLRNLHNLVHSTPFQLAFEKASPESRQAVMALITEIKFDEVAAWIKVNGGKVTMLDLKEKGRTLKIVNWSRLSRAELEDAIEQADRVNREVRDRENLSIEGNQSRSEFGGLPPGKP